MITLQGTDGGYCILNGAQKIGVIEYKDFWRSMPYLSLIKLDEECRGKGYGRQAMRLFEEEMKRLGFKAVLVSTQSDEEAQHFYRKIGYSECGCLILENTPVKQAMELFFIKSL